MKGDIGLSILSCLIWGSVNALGVFSAIRWYLPRLQDDSNKLEEIESGMHNKVKNKRMRSTILLVSTAIAIVCGWIAYNKQVEIVDMVKILITLCILSVISITDIEFYKIPNLCVFMLIISRVLCFIPEFIMERERFGINCIGSIVTGGLVTIVLLVISKMTHSGIGYGDVKLFGAIGFMYDISLVLYTLVFGFFICAIVSTILLVAKVKNFKDVLPLGPFIWFGFVATILLRLY